MAFCCSRPDTVKKTLIGAKVDVTFVNEAGVHGAKQAAFVKIRIQWRIEFYPVYSIIEASPKVLVIVTVQAEYRIVLHSAGLVDPLDHISLLINDHKPV